jgi:hypothetical protein
MTISLNKYDTLGRPLTKEEVDENWDTISGAINDALSGILPVSGIILVDDETGQYLRFLDDGGDPIASIPFPAMLATTGDWETLTDYTTRHIVTHQGGTYLCRVAHTAEDFDIDLLEGKWALLGSNAAQSIAYDPTGTGLDAVTTQDAISELAAMLGDELTADRVHFDNAASGLTGTNVQAAINELAARSADISAADVSVDPVGSVSATDMQMAVAQIVAKIDTPIAVAAADVSVDAIAGVNGATAQEVLEDLKSQIDAVAPGEGGGSAATTSFDPSAVGTVTSATDVQGAIEDVVAHVLTLEPGGGPITTVDVSYSGGAWGIGGSNVQEALVAVGEFLQTFDNQYYHFPAAQVELDLGFMDPFFTSNSLQAALNQLAAFEARIAALEAAAAP